MLTPLVTPVICAYVDELRSLGVGKLGTLPDWFWERLRRVSSRLTDAPASKGPAGEPADRTAAGE